MTAATFAKSRRYIEARTPAPSPTEALTLTIYPDKSADGQRRFRLLLEGAYAIVCNDGHVHPLAVREQATVWVADDDPEPEHEVLLDAYAQDAAAAERLIGRMLGWALAGWSAPCRPHAVDNL